MPLPLPKLTRKEDKFVWTSDYEVSFQELKKRLRTAPVLALPLGSGGFMIYGDASLKGLGCVLVHTGESLRMRRDRIRFMNRITGLTVSS